MMATGRVSRSAWLAGAFEVLTEGGAAAIKVEPLAARLGVTKGSFYHHFANRRELLLAMCESWEEISTLAVIDMVDDASSEPDERLRTLFRTILTIDERGCAVEAAMHAWASADPEVAEFVARVDEQRISYVAKLIRAGGVARGLARRRAQLGYRAMIGEFVWRGAGGPPATRTEIDELVDVLVVLA